LLTGGKKRDRFLGIALLFSNNKKFWFELLFVEFFFIFLAQISLENGAALIFFSQRISCCKSDCKKSSLSTKFSFESTLFVSREPMSQTTCNINDANFNIRQRTANVIAPNKYCSKSSMLTFLHQGLVRSVLHKVRVDLK